MDVYTDPRNLNPSLRPEPKTELVVVGRSGEAGDVVLSVLYWISFK